MGLCCRCGINAEEPEEEQMATFGEALAATRQAAGLSQRALAQAAGVDASYVNRLERGERQAPEAPRRAGHRRARRRRRRFAGRA